MVVKHAIQPRRILCSSYCGVWNTIIARNHRHDLAGSNQTAAKIIPPRRFITKRRQAALEVLFPEAGMVQRHGQPGRAFFEGLDR